MQWKIQHPPDQRYGSRKLIFKSKPLIEGWHLYSQFTPTNSPTGLSSTPMDFAFDKTLLQRVGKEKMPGCP
jgi:hypothetical protein